MTTSGPSAPSWSRPVPTRCTSSETIIVTTDGARRALARGEGLRTKRSVRSLRHLSRPPGSRGLWLPSFPEWIPIPSFAGLLLTTLVAGLAVFIALGVVPVMKVTVNAQTIPREQDVEIIVDPSASSAAPRRERAPAGRRRS
jgi:hypothetical protein